MDAPRWTLGRGRGSLRSEASRFARAAFGEHPCSIPMLAKLAEIRTDRLHAFLEGGRELGSDAARRLADAIGFVWSPSGTRAQLDKLPRNLCINMPHDARRMLKWAEKMGIRPAAIVEASRPATIGRPSDRPPPSPAVTASELSNIASGRRNASPSTVAAIADAISMVGTATGNPAKAARAVLGEGEYGDKGEVKGLGAARLAIARRQGDAEREVFLARLQHPDAAALSTRRYARENLRRINQENRDAKRTLLDRRTANAAKRREKSPSRRTARPK